MKTIKYLGGIHALAKGEEDIYIGQDAGEPVSLVAGDEIDVSDEKAAQVADDFPGCFAIDGKTAGSKRKAAKQQSDDSDGDGDDDLAGKLLAHNREELNAAAAQLGIEDADKLPNKQAVVDAIVAKKAETAENE